MYCAHWRDDLVMSSKGTPRHETLPERRERFPRKCKTISSFHCNALNSLPPKSVQAVEFHFVPHRSFQNMETRRGILHMPNTGPPSHKKSQIRYQTALSALDTSSPSTTLRSSRLRDSGASQISDLRIDEDQQIDRHFLNVGHDRSQGVLHVFFRTEPYLAEQQTGIPANEMAED